MLSTDIAESVHTAPPVLIFTQPAAKQISESWLTRKARPFWQKFVPLSLRGMIYKLREQRRMRKSQARPVSISLSRLLLGDQAGLSAGQFAQLTRQFLYPSTPVTNSPYTEFLASYRQYGNDVLEPAALRETSYFQLVSACIKLTGKYREADDQGSIDLAARHFLNHLFYRTGQHNGSSDCVSAHTPNASSIQPIEVRPIAYSDCFQVIDGHHRIAIAYEKGIKELPAFVRDSAVLTPLQSVLLNGDWLKGRHELYQPIEAPELKKKWLLVRKCTDRLTKMKAFLQDHELLPPTTETYLDVGSAYGWFVHQMSELGYVASGVDRDLSATVVGAMAYGLDMSKIANEDIVHFLRQHENNYDIVSCMSVLHHYAKGFMKHSAEDLIRLLDKTTRRVLFFETGQSHEQWHRDSLPKWDADFIEAWLRQHTSFRSIHRLGPDEDAQLPFEDNYRRMLFACCR